MPIKLYNTLTRKKEILKPLKDNAIRMYTCGPTVYDCPHIGNYRAYIVSDILKRYLRFRGYAVRHVMNITDVDDKTIKSNRAYRGNGCPREQTA
jgi:cysteinyl-tRNA synthetase